MRPGILLVCDPDPVQPWLALEEMLSALGARPEQVVARRGAGWAAAAVRPPCDEPTCGGTIHVDRADVLIWAGEVFAPPSILAGGDTHEAIAAWLLERVRAGGVEDIARLDGAFCGAWFDGRERRWTVFNDRMGLLPVFWSADGARLVASPQAAVTWRGTGTPLEISSAGVVDLIRTQNTVEDHTLIKGVHWLKRGHALSWSEQGARCERTWELCYQPKALTAGQACDWYVASMRQALERHTTAAAPLLLGISGGLDARLFLAICEELGRVPACFTAGWPFYEDVRFGRQLARVAGAPHAIAPLEPEGLGERLTRAIIDSDGLQSAAHLAPVASVQAWLSGHAGAVLLEGFFNGLIGGCTVPADEDISDELPAHEQRWARTMLHSGGSLEFARQLLEPQFGNDSEAEWRERVDRAYRAAPGEDPLTKVEYAIASARCGRVDVLGSNLAREHVLVRNPAADRAMIEWHQSVAPALRRGRRLYLQILTERYPRYARVPRADGCWGLPIHAGRIRREYHWHFERLYRGYLGLRHPWTRAWGTGSKAIRAWAFDTWRRAGGLQELLAPDARVLNWVRRDTLLRLWREAEVDALRCEPLLTLATIEIAIRRLEHLSAQASGGSRPSASTERRQEFRPDNASAVAPV